MDLEKPSRFKVRLRIPGWAREEPIPLGLYRYVKEKNDEVLIKVNGEILEADIDKGYAVIDKKWQKGDEIVLSLPMNIRRVVSDENVVENRGMVALERGPLVYCAEGVDNEGQTSNIILPDQAELSERYVDDLIGGITLIEGKSQTRIENGEVRSADFTAIPYLAWLNRGKGEMDIWLPRDIEALKRRPY